VAPPELSAIVLCYRAGEAIHRVMDPLHRQLEDSGIAHELVLVANQSGDDPDPTVEVVQRFARDHPNVRAVVEEEPG
jgi:hypothetical protein